jgi:hypothetical protein
MKPNLNNIFSDFIETIFGELKLEARRNNDPFFNGWLSYTENDEKEYFGYFTSNRKGLTFHFYNGCHVGIMIKGMFGRRTKKLLLKYLNDKFPEMKIVDFK